MLHEGTTGAMILQTMVTWAGQYNECAARHNALADVVQSAREEPIGK